MATETIDNIPMLHYWQDAVRALMRNSIALLRLAGEPVNDENIIKLVESLPRSRAELGEERWRGDYCCETLREAFVCAGSTGAFREINDYFLAYFTERHYLAQEVLIDSVRVVLKERGR